MVILHCSSRVSRDSRLSSHLTQVMPPCLQPTGSIYQFRLCTDMLPKTSVEFSQVAITLKTKSCVSLSFHEWVYKHLANVSPVLTVLRNPEIRETAKLPCCPKMSLACWDVPWPLVLQRQQSRTCFKTRELSFHFQVKRHSDLFFMKVNINFSFLFAF